MTRPSVSDTSGSCNVWFQAAASVSESRAGGAVRGAPVGATGVGMNSSGIVVKE